MEQDLERVLVLLASFNGVRYLKDQIDSILMQVGVQVNIVVYDDCSKDGTSDFLQRTYNAEPRVEIRENASPTGSAGGNFRSLFRDADLAGYDYVALADQDDIWSSDKLLISISKLRSTGCHGYSCAVTAFWSDDREAVVGQSAAVRSLDYLFEGAGQGCTFVVPTSRFQSVQAFCRSFPTESDSLHYHDWLIYLLVRSGGGQWFFDETPRIRYRQHGGNEIGARGGVLAIRKRLALIRNGWYANQIRGALSIAYLAQDDNAALHVFSSLYERRKSFYRRLRLGLFVFRHGRRKLVDRAVLSISAFMQWI